MRADCQLNLIGERARGRVSVSVGSPGGWRRILTGRCLAGVKIVTLVDLPG